MYEFSEQIISITAATIPFVKPKDETDQYHDEILKKRFSDLLH
jgi:hypothetical protein